MKSLNLNVITLDQRLQSRVKIDENTVAEYAEAIKEGDKFPEIVVFFDGVEYYLTDGYHRFHAHKRAGKASILADVRSGTLRDAILYSVGVNSKHGMRRTIDDKRKAVMTLLEDFEWNLWSNSEIARQCDVSHPFVASVRNAIGQKQETVKYKTPTGEVAEKKKIKQEPVKEAPEAPKEESSPVVEDHTQEAIDMLVAENEDLKARLAVAAMDATPEERQMAQQTIAELKDEVRILKIENEAVKKSRDTFQQENAQLKKQVKMLMKKIQKAGLE